MARVGGEEMFQPGWEQDAKQGAEELLKTFDLLDQEILEINESVKKLQKTLKLGTNIENVKKLNKAFQDSNKTRKAAITIDEEKIKLEAKLKTLRSDSIQQNTELKLQIQAQTKANKELAKETLGLTNAYDKLVKRTDQAQKNFKKLAAEFGVNSKEAKKAKVAFDALDKELREINQDAKDGRRDVGRYGDAIKGTVGSLKSFASALGIVGGVQLLTKVIRNSFNTIKDFEQSIANLSAITGATGEDLDFLENKAKELGRVTTLSATQVAEGFKIIASAKPELLEDAAALALVTEQSIILAEAAGITLPESAAAVTNALNQFGEGADKTAEFVDVLAAGSKFGAGDINFLNEALIKSGTIASNANFTFAETAAALELLAEKGIPASVSGTKLAGVILNLQKAGIGFVSGQFDFNDALEETRVKLAAIEDPVKRAQTELDLFGKQNLAAGQTFLAGGDRLDELNEKLKTSGVAAEQAAINNDTLEGAIKLLNSAWEGYILGADGAGGITDKLKGIVQFLAENLDTILNVIIKVTTAFVAYKTATIAVNLVTKIFNTLIPKADKSLTKLNKTAKLNPFGLIAAAIALLLPDLIQATKELFGFNERTDVLVEVTQEVTEKMIEEKAALKELGIALNETTTASAERQEILDEINAKYGTTLENLESEKDFLIQIEEAYRGIVSALEDKLRAEVKQEKLKELLREEFEIIQAIADLEAEGFERGGFGITAGILPKLDESLEEVRERIAKLGGEIAEEEIGDDLIDIDQIESDVDEIDGIGEKAKKAQDTRNKKIQDLQKQHQLELIKIENEGIAAGLDREQIEALQFERRRAQLIEELALVKKLFKEGSKEAIEAQIRLQNEFLKLAEKQNVDRLEIQEEGNAILLDEQSDFAKAWLKINDDIAKAIGKKEKEEQAKRIKVFKETTKQLIDISRSLTEAREAEIDQRIEKENQEIETSESRIDSLEEAARQGNITAQESIKAEEERIAASEREISELEKKKANLLAFTVALKLLEQSIDSGDNNAVVNAGAKLIEFLGNIPKFIEGTGAGTIADVLGKPHLNTSEDQYLVRTDGREKILNPKQAAMTGNLSADEIAYGAMRWHGDKKMMGSVVKRNSEPPVQNNNKEIVDAIKDIKITEHKTSVDAMRNVAKIEIKDANRIERTHKRVGGTFS